MLGRAKWCVHVLWSLGSHDLLYRDAWEKLKNMESHEAKWRYVDALLKVNTFMDPLSKVLTLQRRWAGTVTRRQLETLSANCNHILFRKTPSQAVRRIPFFYIPGPTYFYRLSG